MSFKNTLNAAVLSLGLVTGAVNTGCNSQETGCNHTNTASKTVFSKYNLNELCDHYGEAIITCITTPDSYNDDQDKVNKVDCGAPNRDAQINNAFSVSGVTRCAIGQVECYDL